MGPQQTKGRIRFEKGSDDAAAVKESKVSVAEFQCIEPHPYGVLPCGNAFSQGLTTTATTTTGAEQSSITTSLVDEVVQVILSYCDGISLGRVVQTSRQLYVAGHQPELWRDLTLRESEVLKEMRLSWKDTYVHRKFSESYTGPHVPMKVAGVFSDTYYRTHVCRSFSIPKQWSTTASPKDTIDRIERPSIQHFLRNYEYPNRPVVLKGAAKSWPAFTKWRSFEYMREATASQTFRATSGAAPLPAQFTLSAYQQYCSSFGENLEEAPLYLFDRTALSEGSTLHSDVYPSLGTSCPFFDPSFEEHDLFQWLGEGKRPDHTWLIMGPQRSGSSFHIDPNATHAWNAAIRGRKRWIFYPPGCAPPGVHPSLDGDHVTMPISLGEWLLNYWEEHMERYHNPDKDRRPLECTVEEGDVLFVPHGWWHSVINLDPVNIAVTHNFVAKSNLSNVLKFLQTKQDQISGCRDRAESVKPEMLYDEFCTALARFRPEWLEEAQRKAKGEWTCAAWNDPVATDERSENRWQSKKKRKRTKSDAESTSIIAKAKAKDGTDHGFSFSFGL